MKAHNKLRAALKNAENKRQQVRMEKQFRHNPCKFADALLSDSQRSLDPTFTKEVAEEYFMKTYKDNDRAHEYTPLPEMVRPTPPKLPFREIQEALKNKRNGAAPGLNGVPYVPFKKCPSLQKALHRIFVKIWETGDIPNSWATAFIVLLSKSEQTSDFVR